MLRRPRTPDSLTGHQRVVNTRGYAQPWMARTILVVEDEPTLRETIVDALEADGFRVVAAADGREALTQFRGERPDLVLLDLMLPELSGIEVTRIIRAESGVPIVMLTAKDSELDKVVGLELGADDYVTKPFSLRELTARIRALFRRSEAAVATGRAADDRRPRPGPGRPRRPSAPARRRGPADQAQGVRAARVPHPEPGPGLHARPAAREGVGLRLRRRDAHGRRPRPLAAQPDRGGPGPAGVHPHGPWRRLRLPPARHEADSAPDNVDPRADAAFTRRSTLRPCRSGSASPRPTAT